MELVLGERISKPFGPGSHMVPKDYMHDGNRRKDVPENACAIPPKLARDPETKKWRLDFYGMPPDGKGIKLFSYYFTFETEVIAFLKGKQ